MKIKQECLLAEVAPDSLLGAPVLDEQGRVLVPAGTTLTASLLGGLARREVERVVILADEAEDPEARQARLVRLENALSLRFRHAGDYPEGRTLRQAIFDYLKEAR